MTHEDLNKLVDQVRHVAENANGWAERAEAEADGGPLDASQELAKRLDGLVDAARRVEHYARAMAHAA